MDERILALLSRDGRMSYTDIGRETGLSTSAAQQRVRRLEQRGIITGYRAQIDPAALGKLLTAFVEVRSLDPANEDHIPDKIAGLREVVSCYSVAGTATLILVVQVGTPQDLETLLGRIRQVGHVSTQTTLVLSIPFENRPIV